MALFFRSPPPPKRYQKQSIVNQPIAPQLHQPILRPAPPQLIQNTNQAEFHPNLAPSPIQTTSPTSNKKRKMNIGVPTQSPVISAAALGDSGGSSAAVPAAGEGSLQPPTKKSRTNTPWTPAEEMKLKTLRDAGSSWSDIAKVRKVIMS